MFDFADHFNKLNLKENELALFSAIVLFSPDRPGLRNVEQIRKLQETLLKSLENLSFPLFPHFPHSFLSLFFALSCIFSLLTFLSFSLPIFPTCSFTTSLLLYSFLCLSFSYTFSLYFLFLTLSLLAFYSSLYPLLLKILYVFVFFVFYPLCHILSLILPIFPPPAGITLLTFFLVSFTALLSPYDKISRKKIQFKKIFRTAGNVKSFLPFFFLFLLIQLH
ncbi:unnamed protein product [Acanthosepion pharaonis]|uniref:NR LBD domain-containing protein n=1 Tax=Acanthosepion pharaonis TaxID=158019 RepID=A0A812CZV2_ACAPH|nr:unnamed protein product [Sepia pharaonis]